MEGYICRQPGRSLPDLLGSGDLTRASYRVTLDSKARHLHTPPNKHVVPTMPPRPSTPSPCADALGLRLPRTPKTTKQQQRGSIIRRPYHPRQRCSIDSIKRGLGLEDGKYREFYTIMERIITRRGWIGNTFRSISEKETVYSELSTLVLASQDTNDRFPAVVERMRTPTGQAAFQGLVCKICTNFRRRSKQQIPHRHDVPVPNARDLDATAPSRDDSAECNGKNKQSPPAAEIWQGMVSITRKDGELKALCRPCELARGWSKGLDYNSAGIDDLDFERFISILEGDHGFNRNSDSLTWEESPKKRFKQPSTIDNDRQWKAVIAHMIRQGHALNFLMVTRDDVGG